MTCLFTMVGKNNNKAIIPNMLLDMIHRELIVTENIFKNHWLNESIDVKATKNIIPNPILKLISIICDLERDFLTFSTFLGCRSND